MDLNERIEDAESALKKYMKDTLWGGGVLLVDAQVKDVTTYSVYLSLPEGVLDIPVMTIGFEKVFREAEGTEFTDEADGKRTASLPPVGFYVQALERAPSIKIEKPPSKANKDYKEKKKKLPTWAEEYPGFDLEKWQELYKSRTSIQNYVNDAFKASKEYTMTLLEHIEEQAIVIDYDYFFDNGMTIDKALAELWKVESVSGAAYSIFKLAKKLGISVDQSKTKAEGLVNKAKVAASQAVKSISEWAKGGLTKFGKKAGDRLSKFGKKVGNTFEQAFAPAKIKSFGGVDLSSYEPSIKGYKILTDSRLEAYELSTPVDYIKFRSILKHLKDNVSWIKPKGDKIMLYSVKGKIEDTIRTPKYTRIKDGQIVSELLLDKELRILDQESRIKVLDVDNDKIIIKYL